LCVNLAKRLKVNAEKSNSDLERAKAVLMTALSLRNVGCFRKEPACWFANSLRSNGARKEVWLPGLRPKRLIESRTREKIGRPKR
jgi:hypothetical protein